MDATVVVCKLPAGGGAVSRQNLSKFNLEETRDPAVVAGSSIVLGMVVVSGVVVVVAREVVIVVVIDCAVVSVIIIGFTVSDIVDWMIAAFGAIVSVMTFGSAAQHAGAGGMDFLVGHMASFLNMSVSQTLFS